MITIALSGFGKMNKEVFSAAMLDTGFRIASILEPHGNKVEGVNVFDEPESAFASADIVVDFSTKNAAPANAIAAANLGKNIIIGTTGIAPEDITRIREAITKNKTSGVISANFSIGVNIFIEAAKFLADRLSAYDMEMLDIHHRLKIDSPSGTVLRTLQALNKSDIAYGRKGIGERKKEVGVHSLRVGDVIGDHALIFGGNAERIELWHKATSRRCFAQGALLSAKWIHGKKDGILHDFKDVLNS